MAVFKNKIKYLLHRSWENSNLQIPKTGVNLEFGY